MPWPTIGLLSLAALLAVATFGTTEAPPPPPAYGGGDFEANLTSSGRTRTYTLHVPRTITEEQAVSLVIVLHGLERVTYVSATTACEENRWFEVIDVKMRTEDILRRSGIAHTVFCPTWVMETRHNFIHGDQATVIPGKNPPALHFFAAADFGRMVAASYEDDRALGKRLFVHGPAGITLPDTLERFVKACHPQLKVMRLKLWQARLIAKLTGRKGLTYVTRLIAYFDKVGELGDPTEANALFGAMMSSTMPRWSTLPSNRLAGHRQNWRKPRALPNRSPRRAKWARAINPQAIKGEP